MSDSKDEPTPLTEETTPEEPMTQEPTPDSRLTERLLARATQSLGVIDVRRAESHYTRLTDWLAARTPLLEHLRSRYGLTEGEGLTGLGLAFAAAHVSDEAVNLSAAPDSFTSHAAEQLFTAVAQVPDDSAAAETEAKRITRRGVPTFSHASSDTHPGTRQGRRDVAPSEQGEVFEHTRERAERNQEQTRGPRPPSSAEEISAAPNEA